MEASSSLRSTWCARMRTSTSASVGSLDIGLLVNTPFVHSLMTESFTFCSLSSSSSKSSNVPPVLQLRNLPTFQMIELGDQLKMFSPADVAQSKDEHARTLNEKGVLVSTPTLPRLKSMLKECLSIAKWVETSARWQPPGHVPWESVKDTAVTWVPEGAIFSPEYFAVALSQSRRTCHGVQSKSEICMPSPCSSPSDEILCTPVPAPRSWAEESMHVELLQMMDELRSIRSFFQDSQDISEPTHSSLPSLVVSNSHFTFPIPLESSRSVSHSSLNSLAIRRGKKRLPTLLLPKSRSAQEISYPGIPTAFLGSPSRHCPTFEDSNISEKPCMDFEEMINNLRLKCSTMSLQTPPIDTSWNSRSTSECNGRLQETCNDDWSFADEFLNDHKRLSLSRSTTSLGTNRDHRPATSFTQSVLRGQRSSPQTILVPGRNGKDMETGGTINPSPTANSSGSVNENLPLRSAMTKPILPPRLKPSKNVRFYLSQKELQKELAWTVPVKRSIPKEEAVSTPISPAKQQYQKVLKRLPSTAVLSRAGSQRSVNHSTTQSNGMQGRARSATTSSAITHSTVIRDTGALENTKPIPTDVKSRISVQSLGRHSLSRIMKGPIFPARDKRATISSMSVTANDENSARRESVAHDSIHKKSRMPIPLRNMLTRFK